MDQGVGHVLEGLNQLVTIFLLGIVRVSYPKYITSWAIIFVDGDIVTIANSFLHGSSQTNRSQINTI